MGQLAKYSFINAKVRAMLSDLLEPQVLERLAQSGDLSSFIHELELTPYRRVVSKINPDNFEPAALEKEFLRFDLAVYRKIFSSFPARDERDFVFLLTQRYEIEQLKIALRIWHKRAPVLPQEYLLGEKLCFDINWQQILLAQNFEEIIIILDNTPYKDPLLSAREKYKITHSLFYLEIALDTNYYERLKTILEKLSAIDRNIAQLILGIEVDIENINWLVRSKKFYALGAGEIRQWLLPGGLRIQRDIIKNASLTEEVDNILEAVSVGPYARLKDLVAENTAFLERFLYETLLSQVKKALGGFPFTMGTVLGYLILKRRETRNLISLLYARKYGWKSEQIAEVLT